MRDAGGADLGIKQAVADGLVAGPRMQISLRMISQTGGRGDPWTVSGSDVDAFPSHPGIPDTTVDGPEQMRRVVRTLIRQGADVIKVAASGGVLSPRDNPTPRTLPARGARDARPTRRSAAGIWVMAHAQATDGIKNGIPGGHSLDRARHLPR